jgi:Flp pilus assembly protein TadD
VSHEWTFVSSHGGLNFYIGNSAAATGFYHQVPGITPTIGGQATDARRVAEQALGRSLTDAEVSAYFFDLGWGWIRSHPRAAAGLFLRKLAYTFNAAHVALPHSYPFYAYEEGTLLRVLVVGPWLLIPLGLAGLGLVAWRLRRPEYLAWAAFVPAYAGAVALFFVAERYRLPMLMPLTVGAGALLDAGLTTAEARPARIRSLAGALTVVVGLFVFVNWPLHLSDGRWEEGVRLAQRLVILGRYDEAEAWVARMEPREPRPGATAAGAGAQLLVEKQFGRAAGMLRRAVERGDREPMVEYQLGEALLEAGRPAEALPHLRRGVDAGLDLPLGGFSYARALQATGDTAASLAIVRTIHPPDDEPEAWMMVGRLAVAAHDPAAAEPFFARAASLRPEDAAIRQQHGLNLLVLDRLDDASRELARAASLDPRDPDTLSRLAYCELKLGRPADAAAHAAAALAINPGDPLARELLRTLPR